MKILHFLLVYSSSPVEPGVPETEEGMANTDRLARASSFHPTGAATRCAAAIRRRPYRRQPYSQAAGVP
jgi:hypothetical protein